MSYRITGKNGRTIGYARNQGIELAGMLVGSIAVIVLAMILVPLFLVGYGVVLSAQGFLIFWDWATAVSLTPFPNLNGVLVITMLGIVGGLLVRYMRVHLVLLVSFTHILSLTIATFMVSFWIIAILVAIGVIAGIPLLAVSWLFSTITPIAILLGIGQQFTLVLSNVIEPVWLIPLVFPTGWLCAKIIGIFDKRELFATTSNLTPTAGLNFLLLAIASWVGMLLLNPYLSTDKSLLPVLGSVLGVALWGAIKGTYKFTIRRDPLNARSKS